MESLNIAPMDVPRVGLDADEIEQRIIRAYVQLACRPLERGEYRSLTIVRLPHLNVRLTEVSPEIRGMLLFWLEVYSDSSQSVIDSCRCSEFDDDELATAVEMIMSAEESARSRRHQ